MKTEGRLQQRAYQLTKWLTLILLAVIVAVSIWTPLIDAQVAQRWFSMPNLAWFVPVPVLVIFSAVTLVRGVSRQWNRLPFVCAVMLIFLGYSGLAISLWPDII